MLCLTNDELAGAFATLTLAGVQAANAFKQLAEALGPYEMMVGTTTHETSWSTPIAPACEQALRGIALGGVK